MTQKLYLQWQQCKARNPGLLLQLAGLARELKLSGHSRYSMDGLFHILRWETRATTGDLGLKINNNHTAFAARDLMGLGSVQDDLQRLLAMGQDLMKVVELAKSSNPPSGIDMTTLEVEQL